MPASSTAMASSRRPSWTSTAPSASRAETFCGSASSTASSLLRLSRNCPSSSSRANNASHGSAGADSTAPATGTKAPLMALPDPHAAACVANALPTQTAPTSAPHFTEIRIHLPPMSIARHVVRIAIPSIITENGDLFTILSTFVYHRGVNSIFLLSYGSLSPRSKSSRATRSHPVARVRRGLVCVDGLHHLCRGTLLRRVRHAHSWRGQKLLGPEQRTRRCHLGATRTTTRFTAHALDGECAGASCASCGATADRRDGDASDANPAAGLHGPAQPLRA